MEGRTTQYDNCSLRHLIEARKPFLYANYLKLFMIFSSLPELSGAYPHWCLMSVMEGAEAWTDTLKRTFSVELSCSLSHRLGICKRQDNDYNFVQLINIYLKVK